MSPPRSVVIAGSTGSIGTQALEVLASCPDRFQVTGLGGGSSVLELAEQAATWHPKVVAIADASLEADLRALLPNGVEVRAFSGQRGAKSRLYRLEILPDIKPSSDSGLIRNQHDGYAQPIAPGDRLCGTRDHAQVIRTSKVVGILDNHSVAIEKYG